MTIRNFLLYLQVLTLTASIMNENTDLGKSKTSEHQLNTGEISKEFYRPGDISKLSSFVSSVNIKKPVPIKKVQKHDQPKISPAKQFPNVPSRKITSAKFFKDKKLNQEYKRLQQANNPSKNSDSQSEPLEAAPDRNVFLVETPSVSSNNGENRIPMRLLPVPSYSSDGANISSSTSNKELDNKKRTLCFVDSCVRLKSFIVPCQYMSRAFHFLLTCDVSRKAIIFVAQERRTDFDISIQILFAHTDETISTYENYFSSQYEISSNNNVSSNELRLETQSTQPIKDQIPGETTSSNIKIPSSTEPPPSISEVLPTSAETPPISTETPPTSTETPPTSTETPPTSIETPPTSTETPPTSTETPPAGGKEVLPEEAKQEEDISSLKKDPDMPSFDEWKLQQEDQKEQTSHNTISHAKQKVAKKEINYASITCGAKIIQANPEAQNLAFVLYENKDQYMNNPCSAKKGFTVELCESVQIQVFELGNMEFFSSNPHKFEVHASERFPVKDWIHLGTFEAKNERIIQTFPIEQQSIGYAKYIRIDILSHYGNEHFCPLSVLRVFGNSLDDDDEVEISHDETDFRDVVDVLNNSMSPDDPKLNNLFTKATDTVLSIMKTVLPSSDSISKNGHDNDTGSLISLHSNATNSSDDVASDWSVNWKDQLQHCQLDFESSSPEITPHKISHSKKYECSYYELLCKVCNKPICPSSYFELENKSVESVHNREVFSNEVDVKNHSVKDKKSRDVDQMGQQSDSIKNNEKSTESDGNLKSDFSLESKIAGVNGDRAPATTVGTVSDSGAEFSDVTDKFAEKNHVPDCDDVSDDKIHHDYHDYDDINDLLKTTETGDHQFVHKEESSNNLADVDNNKKHSTNFSNVAKATSTADQSDGPSLGEVADLLANQKKNISSETPPTRLEPLKDYEFDGSNMDDITYQKLYSKGKESVFAKLRNRIKNLETNLNLTNRYLEELSQRYKKQTDDMHTSLDKTFSKLINTAKSAEEKVMRQEEKVQNLEMKLSNVTMVVASLHRSLQDIHAQVLERHVILMVIEFLFFIVLLTFCQSARRPQRFNRSTGTTIAGEDEEYDGYSHLESSSENQTPTCTSKNHRELSGQSVEKLKLAVESRALLCSRCDEPIADRGDTSGEETKGEIQRNILKNVTNFQHSNRNSIIGESVGATAENDLDDLDLKSFQCEKVNNIKCMNNNYNMREDVGLQNIISTLPASDRDRINDSLSFVSLDDFRTKTNSNENNHELLKSKRFLPKSSSSPLSSSSLLDVTKDSSNFEETSIEGPSVVNAVSEISRNSAENILDRSTKFQRVCGDEILTMGSTTKSPKKRVSKLKKKVDVGSKWTAGVAGYFDRMSAKNSFDVYRPQNVSCYSAGCIKVQYADSDTE